MLQKTIIKNNAFTLIEILIIASIIMILTSIASSTYTHYLITSNRNSAKIALLKISIALEDYFSEHNSYSGANLSKLNISSTTETKKYKLQISSGRTTYKIYAIPIGTQKKDKICGTFTFDCYGNKKNTGKGSSEYCWGQ